MTPFEALLRSLVEIAQWVLVFALALKLILVDHRLRKLETKGVTVELTIERTDGRMSLPASKTERKPN